MGFLDTMFGPSGSSVASVRLPKFERDIADPKIEPRLEELRDVGMGLMTGEGVPAWLRPGTEIAGPEFQRYLQAVRGDVTEGALEAGALTGRRNVAPIVGREMSRVTPGLRYQNFLDAIGRRFGLFGTGLQTRMGILGERLGRERTKGQFALQRAGLALGRAETAAGLDAARSSALGQTIGGFISGGANLLAGKQISNAISTLGSANTGGNPAMFNYLSTQANPRFTPYS